MACRSCFRGCGLLGWWVTMAILGASAHACFTLSHETTSASLSLDGMRPYALPAAACFNIHPMRRLLEFTTELRCFMPRDPLAGYRISSGAASGHDLAAYYSFWRRLPLTLAQDVPQRPGARSRPVAAEGGLLSILYAYGDLF